MGTRPPANDPVVGNLPSPRAHDSFVGREEEAATVRQQLVNSRLVTLTGVGGVGKTRLALHVAQNLSPSAFPHGIWLVELTSHRDPELVIDAIVTTLGLYSEVATLDVLTGHLASRRILLVLDNCEHLIDAVAKAVAALLDRAPDLRVLVTSREPLGIDGEHVVIVPPLAVPPMPAEPFGPADTMPYDAVRLLIARVEAMGRVDFGETADPVLAARLVRRLDGLPLAIVLAAARLYSLSLEVVLEQINDRFGALRRGGRDAPTHHKTLWSCIDWSYELCSSPQQVLWRRLTVFSGQFATSDVASICSDEQSGTIDNQRIDTLLEDLVRQSVVQRESGSSYYLLEMVREYGIEQQRRAGVHEEDRLRRRHAEYYRGMALDIASNRFSRNEDFVPEIRREIANLRVALEWFIGQGDDTEVLKFALALTEAAAWFTAASMTEGRRYLMRAMEIPGESSNYRVIAAAHIAWWAVLQSDPESAIWVKRCRQEAQHLGAPAGAFANWAEGLHLCFQEGSESSVALLSRALEEIRASESPRYIYLFSLYLANACLKFNKLETADTASRLCLEYTESRGDEYATAWARLLRGLTELSQGQVERARELLHKSLHVQLKIGAFWGLDWTVQALSWAATSGGKYELAIQLMGAASKLRTISAQDKKAGFQSYFDSNVAQVDQIIRRHLSPEKYQSAFAFGVNLSSDQAISLALGNASFETSGQEVQSTLSPALTSREHEVAALVTKGFTNRQIGEKLFISRRTVDTHVQKLMKKLDTRNRTDIALWFSANSGPTTR